VTRRRSPAGARRAPDPASLIDLGAREHYADAALYDFEYRRRRLDVSAYRRIARARLGAGGDVLELACGSGRLTTALCRDGHRVVGFDLSAAMVARARDRLARLPAAAAARGLVYRGDLRGFALARRFPLVVAAFNAFEHLYTRVELEACLARVREHLAPDGRLAFDVQVPDPAWLARDPARRWARTRFRHPETGERLEYSTSHEYDPVHQIALIRLHYRPLDGGRERVVHLSQRKFFPAELEALVHAAGLRVESAHGDFSDGPLAPGAISQLLVCRAR
jgi:SAM-dependent methyltransferase